MDNWQSPDFRLDRPNGSPNHLFVLFKSPARVFETDGYTDVGSGTAICYGKNRRQNYFPLDGVPFLNDFLHFELETEEERAVFSEIPVCRTFPVPFPDLISEILSMIKNEFLGGFSESRQEIVSHLGAMFLYRLRDETRMTMHPGERLYFRAMNELRSEVFRHPEKAWSIDAACGRLCLSRSYFQHLYRTFFGNPFMADVIAARIDAAKALLAVSDIPVSEIALQCGYLSPQHFTRQFKEVTGISPSVFRWNLKKGI